MQKWEEKQKHRVHEFIIDNAKSTFKRYSNSREKIMHTSRTKPIQKKKLPFHRILEIFQLQKYSSLLNSHGFPEKLTKKDSFDYIDDMVEKVDERDKQRFLSLLNTLIIMSKDLKKVQKTPTINRSRKSIYPPPPSTSSNSKPTPYSVQKSEKTTSKFRIKNKQPISQYHPSNINSIKQQRKRIEREGSLPRRKERKSFSRGVASDDLSLIHDFRTVKNGEIKSIEDSNRIIQKLLAKLNINNSGENSKQNNLSEEIKLEMKKIKEMYLSYDSAALTSNIVNIDLSELIDCLALQIVSLLEEGNFTEVVCENKDKIKSLLQESFLMVKEESKDSKTQNQEGEVHEKIEVINHEDIEIPENSSVKSSVSSELCSIELNEEDNFMASAFMESVISDFNCFDNKFVGSYFSQKPQRQDVKNFIQLVMMAGKLQKQIPIISYVYLKRLLKNVKGSKVTERNWRNLLLVTLIQGSKIWDDQSLENHSFSKVIKPYTTLEINRLQKYLLFFLDYRLTINQKEYSESYFGLRKHSHEASHTANLMKLDLGTIQKLQKTSKKGEVKRKQYFKKLMNKSF